jgi:hypothetical protein
MASTVTGKGVVQVTQTVPGEEMAWSEPQQIRVAAENARKVLAGPIDQKAHVDAGP